VRQSLAQAVDSISDLITDKTTTGEGTYLNATAQTSVLSAIALTLAELTDVIADDRPRLTQLKEDLWVDLSEVQSVSTYTDPNTYHRLVILTMRNGKTHRIVAARSRNTVKEGDEALEKWLDENLRGKIL
jgi:hypothetical protein